MWSTVDEYAILAPKRLPGLPETPGVLQLLHQETIIFKQFNYSTGWGENAARAFQMA